MATGTVTITAEERARREAECRDVFASLRIEGLYLDPETKALFQRYIDGEFSGDDLGRAIDELNDREFGPVRLPGD